MRHSLFIFFHIQSMIKSHKHYYSKKKKKNSFIFPLKMIVTLKLLAQGIIVDFIDEYVRNEESTTT